MVFGAVGLLMASLAIAAALGLLRLPSLEEPACDAARDATRSFYSFHFGNGLAPSDEALSRRSAFLTASLLGRLKGRTGQPEDYFTATADYPKAFRVGGCTAIGAEKTVFEVALFWKDDERSMQRSVRVTSVLSEGRWLVDEVKAEER